ncbi:MAG: CaiB/BaiF CoA transferase family protein [Rubrivivax sp.]|jgi:crotonobetainyl-CoA:carnitine CoA-transferase CaiB-like acyl-CoA transferase|nr:CoA transferase [Rubrivivax sp.]
MTPMTVPLPLAGVRILAVEQYGAGPFGSMHLADLGAEVIKIEPPGGGDVSRATGPHFLGPDDSSFFQTFNRNKSSVVLDLKSDAGRAAFHRLVATSDAVLNNLRGDQPAKLGLTHAALAPLNPRIVCAHLSAYGRDNERAAWPGYDYLMQAEAGFMHLTGEPEGPPSRMGLSIVDYMTGVTCALGLLAAYVGALKTGRGRDVDVSLFDVALFQLTYPAAWQLNGGPGTTRQPMSAHPATVPCQLFPTADGHVFVMCMTPKFWDLLVAKMPTEQRLLEPRFASIAARREHKAELIALLDAQFRQRSTAQWLDTYRGQVPIAPVLDLPQALANPHVHATGMVQALPHPADPDFRLLASPIRLDGQRLPGRVCSALGADTAHYASRKE